MIFLVIPLKSCYPNNRGMMFHNIQKRIQGNDQERNSWDYGGKERFPCSHISAGRDNDCIGR